MTPAKDSNSRNGAPLKQGTLNFSSAKRASSNATANTKKAPQAQRSSSTIVKEKGRVNDAHTANDKESISDTSPAEELLSSLDTAAKSSRTAAQVLHDVDISTSRLTKKRRDGEDSSAVKPVEQRQNLDIAAKKYREHYGRVREKMGNLEPIHAEGQNKIHEILRVFDMSYEYGPCVGMTRLERWERAASFGLKPPEEVRDILLTREGVDMDEYSQCVLYGEV